MKSNEPEKQCYNEVPVFGSGHTMVRRNQPTRVLCSLLHHF